MRDRRSRFYVYMILIVAYFLAAVCIFSFLKTSRGDVVFYCNQVDQYGDDLIVRNGYDYYRYGFLTDSVAFDDTVGRSCLNFTDSYLGVPFVEVENYSGVDIRNASITLMAWVKVNNNDNDQIIIAKPYVVGSHVSPYFLYSLHVLDVVGTTSVRPRFAIDINGSLKTVQSSFLLTDGDWFHIVGVYNNSDMKIYVDGVQYGTTTGVTGDIVSNGNELFIGVNGAYGEGWVGWLDDLRVLGGVYSKADILGVIAESENDQVQEYLCAVVTPTPFPSVTPCGSPLPVPGSASVNTASVASIIVALLMFFGVVWGVRKLILLMNRS